MRILFLTHAFNSLTQRLHAELSALGHEISIEFDIADAVAEEAVALFRPELIVAPYLRRAIPEAIWRTHTCLVVHPGIVGDRGPSALDWAIQTGLAAGLLLSPDGPLFTRGTLGPLRPWIPSGALL